MQSFYDYSMEIMVYSHEGDVCKGHLPITHYLAQLALLQCG